MAKDQAPKEAKARKEEDQSKRLERLENLGGVARAFLLL